MPASNLGQHVTTTRITTNTSILRLVRPMGR